MTAPTTIEQLEQVSHSIPTVGNLVSLTIDNLELNRDDLEARLRQHGLYYFMPKPISGRTALTRALNNLLDDQAKAGGTSHSRGDLHASAHGATTRAEKLYVPPPVNLKDDNAWMFTVQLQRADAARLSVEFETKLRIRLGKDNRQIFCSWAQAGDIDTTEDRTFARQLQPYWEQAQRVHTNADISALVYKAIRACASVSVRRDGGVYFVPDGEQWQLEKIVAFVNGLRQGTTPNAVAYCVSVGVPDAPQDKSNLGAAVHQGMVDELAGLRTELKRMIESKPGTLRKGTVAARIQEYRALRRRAETYAELLGLRAESVVGQLATMSASVLELLERAVPGEDDSED